ncbi:hypothetical protein MAR_004155 [Mya arenaria]|uniref:Period circadian-like C-terminal domain-containing protein n=1 Tax=Mya arenaria TaxID=6604 RepID=A0ABY7EXI1_MYAAR|nr:hypothetical protein MAR_004155 [Mya arenaria]
MDGPQNSPVAPMRTGYTKREHLETQPGIQSELEGEEKPNDSSSLSSSVMPHKDMKRSKNEKKERVKQYLKELKTMVQPDGRGGTLSALQQVLTNMRKMKGMELAKTEKMVQQPSDTDEIIIYLTACDNMVRGTSNNLQTVLGYNRDHWAGRSLDNFLHRADIATYRSILKKSEESLLDHVHMLPDVTTFETRQTLFCSFCHIGANDSFERRAIQEWSYANPGKEWLLHNPVESIYLEEDSESSLKKGPRQSHVAIAEENNQVSLVESSSSEVNFKKDTLLSVDPDKQGLHGTGILFKENAILRAYEQLSYTSCIKKSFSKSDICPISSEEYDFDIRVPKPPSFGSSTKSRAGGQTRVTNLGLPIPRHQLNSYLMQQGNMLGSKSRPCRKQQEKIKSELASSDTSSMEETMSSFYVLETTGDSVRQDQEQDYLIFGSEPNNLCSCVESVCCRGLAINDHGITKAYKRYNKKGNKKGKKKEKLSKDLAVRTKNNSMQTEQNFTMEVDDNENDHEADCGPDRCQATKDVLELPFNESTDKSSKCGSCCSNKSEEGFLQCDMSVDSGNSLNASDITPSDQRSNNENGSSLKESDADAMSKKSDSSSCDKQTSSSDSESDIQNKCYDDIFKSLFTDLSICFRQWHSDMVPWLVNVDFDDKLQMNYHMGTQDQERVLQHDRTQLEALVEPELVQAQLRALMEEVGSNIDFGSVMLGDDPSPMVTEFD